MRTLAQIARTSGVTFGTSGARGLVSALTADVCQAYVSAFLQTSAPSAPAVLLGCDLRPSSLALVRRCAAAVLGAGRQVHFAGVLPTPALAFHAAQQGLPALMITGSHIPFDRNGIKFYRADGEISKADEAAMLAACVPAQLHSEPAVLSPCPVALKAYMQRYLGFFPATMLQGLRIGVYQHSSAARDLLVELLGQFGAEVVALGRSDDFVPIDTEAVSAADQALAREWSRQHRLDALVSTDGDADRPLLADETGQWLRGDLLGLLCARYLKIAAVAVPVSCNTAIEQSAAFASVLRTQIGSPHVIAAMQQLERQGYQTVAGFEANGGFLLASPLSRAGRTLAPLPTRDALLPILALLAAAVEQGAPLSGLLQGLPPRFTASDRLTDYATARSHALLAQLTGLAAAAAWFDGKLAAPQKLDTTDGLRLTLANGEIVHLRASGNAPELRCYAEADSPQRAEELVRQVLALCAGH